MFVRVLLAALAAFALASSASAQLCTGTQVQETCLSSQFSTDGTTSGFSASLDLGFSYCAPSAGFGTGTIVGGVTGTLTVNQASGQGTYTVTALSGSITTGQPGSVTPTNINTRLPTGQAPILSFSTVNSISVVPLGATTPTSTATIGSNTPAGATSPSVILAGITVPLSVIPLTLQNLATVVQDSCTAVRGDPLFSGFRGQQFYVGGEDGQVMNMISTFNMQLNGRFVQLNDGAAITPAEQEKLRMASAIRHADQPEVPAFPHTTAWSHPGNYFGEAGVAMLEDNRLYAKAGPFATGFSKVALNGRPLAVSNDFVVLGSGANTTYIQRVSAHEVMVRTVNVEFTLTNSDNFLNVEQVHLERGFRQHNQFSGILGKTVDSKWSWNAEDEKAAVVQSNDLFAKEQ